MSDHLESLLEALAEETANFVTEVTGPLITRIDELERKVSDLQSQAPQYRGIYSAAETYRKGNMVTDKGALWIVRADSTTTRPGTSSDWQLCVKRGAEDGVARTASVRLEQ